MRSRGLGYANTCRGLVAGLQRKNGWTLAEHAGEGVPDGMQRLLRRADWDIDGVRDDVRDYVIERIGDRDGVLIVDDTGFLKKGTRSAEVQLLASTPALRAGSRTARSVFSSAFRQSGWACVNRPGTRPAQVLDQ